MSTSFSRMNLLLRRASRSSVLAFDFFHSRFGSVRGRDTGGDVPAADPVASSRDLFFPAAAAFAVFNRDGFILQVHGVFTRICSGATRVALSGGALRSTAAVACIVWRFLAKIYWEWLLLRWVKNPKGFGFYL
jgi:hypothetical protein